MGCRSNKRRSPDSVYFELHWERDLVRLEGDFNNREVEPLLYAFIDPVPRDREVIACLMQGKILQYHFDMAVRPEVEKRLTDRTFNNRVGFGPNKCIERLMRDIWEVSQGFTKDCWVITRDIQGYFPSSDLDRSYNHYRALIDERFPGGEEKDDLLYILMRVNYSYPADNVHFRNPVSRWSDVIASGKSVIFNCPDGRGACLGNQYWQVEKNFDLNDFDHWQVDTCGMYYGRFVDDMWWVVDNLEAGLAHVALSEKKLQEEYGYHMHPRKRYQQHYTKGGQFISTWFKMDRTYVGNRVVRHAEEKICAWNRRISVGNLDHFLSSVNSYLGLMKHHYSYGIIRGIVAQVRSKWLTMCEYNDERRCLVAKAGFKSNQILERKYNFKLYRYGKTGKNYQYRVAA